MTKLLPETIALRTLRGQQLPPRGRITREQAIELLKRITGQDFGDDADKWAASLRVRPMRREEGSQAEDKFGVFIAMLSNGKPGSNWMEAS